MAGRRSPVRSANRSRVTATAFAAADSAKARSLGAGFVSPDTSDAGGGAASDRRCQTAAMARHVVTCPLRWSDMDSAGHVNNIVHLRYLEEARIDMFYLRAPQSGVSAFTEGTVVAQQEIEYLRPLLYRPQPVRVETWVTRVGNSSFDIAYEIRDDDACYARATSTIVAFNLRANTSRPLRPAERAVLATLRDDSAHAADCRDSVQPEVEPSR